MPKLSVFESITLDGFFAGPNGELDWAHRRDPEWDAFVSGNASGGGVLLFGRVTYGMMVSFWPTPQAKATLPEVAEGMTRHQKVVFSRTLKEPGWQNVRVVSGDLLEEVRRMKREPGPDLVILGSGSIVAQLSEARLIDEYQLALNPVVLGKGRSLFTSAIALKLKRTRAFANGNVVLWYGLRD
jgi:dihydrofolate reductase